MALTKHSLTKRSEILAEIDSSDDRTALFENVKSLNLKFHLRSSSDFEAVCNSLLRFGLSKNEVKIYVYLAKFGEQKAHKISSSLALHRTETYKILRRLEEKSLACRILEKPIRFAAIPVDKALEALIQEKKQRLIRLEEEKKKILHDWDLFSVPARESDVPEEFIQVLKGRNQIHIKVNEILEKAQGEILIAASDENLLQMFYFGSLDGLGSKSSKVKVSLLTNSSLRSSYIIKKLRLEDDEFLCVNFSDLPSFIISNGHLLLFLNSENGNGRNGQRALWTNQKDLIRLLKAAFFSFNEKTVSLKQSA